MNAPAPSRPRILVVDDTPANLIAMRHVLGKVGAQLVEAPSGNAALAACLEHEFALILLDVHMPGMDGFEVAQILSDDDRTRETPIIFVTAAADDLSRLKGYGSGAVDYISKPIDENILRSKVRIFLDLYRSKQALQQANRELQAEIQRRRDAEALARHQATHDPLTGLPNRLLFLDRLGSSLARARRQQASCALLYIDIDGFKPVNDTHGHVAGDELLKAIARRLGDGLRQVDTVARLGGDEFAVVMEQPAGAADALAKAEGLVQRVREPYRIEAAGASALEVRVGASVGVALFPEHAADLDALVRAADTAMYAAKRAGRNRSVLAGR